MSDDQKLYPWQEGQSTKPEIDALITAYPPESIKPGEWFVTDETLKQIIKPMDATRYKTVCKAWRNRLIRDHSVDIERERTKGYYCPTPAQIYAITHPTLEYAGRKIGKQIRRVSASKPTTAIEAATRDHHGKLLYVQKRELKKARMNLLPSTAAPETPKITGPSK